MFPFREYSTLLCKTARWKDTRNQKRNQKKCPVAFLKGSVTVEMSWIMPLVLLVLLFTVYTVFYYHDKNIIIGASAETESAGAQSKRSKGEEISDLKGFCRERIGHKLILLHITEIKVTDGEDMVEVSVQAGKGRMLIQTASRAAVLKPEDKIRKRKQLESIVSKQ